MACTISQLNKFKFFYGMNVEKKNADTYIVKDANENQCMKFRLEGW